MATTSPAIMPAAGAVVPTSPSPETFGQALQTYRRLLDAELHNEKHGALGAVYDHYDRQTGHLGAKYESFDAAPPETAVYWRACFAEMRRAEDVHSETFARPRLRALATLLATPAPSALAALQKLEVALAEEELDEAIIAMVRGDLERLAERTDQPRTEGEA